MTILEKSQRATTGTQISQICIRVRLPRVPLLLLAVALSVCFESAAAEFAVSSVAGINAATAAAHPGDTIVMQDGIWADADILFTGNGTAVNPITLRAQTLGQVFLTGQSRLRISGSYLVVDGLTFTNGYRTSGDVIAFQDTTFTPANNCRLTDCAIVDYNPPNGTSDTKWVSIYGVSNRVDNCYLKGKANVGTTLIVWLDYLPPDRANYHQIDHNYFGPRPPLGTNGSNGGETIRVGTSEFSFSVSRTTVEQNYFEQCSGDVEIISSKSCENIYRHNTFVDCEGALSLRHGNRSIVEANYFFGHHKTNTGGVRIVGDDHKVFNNYFMDLGGSSSRAPLAIMQGIEDSPLNGYFQVHRAMAVFNTFVNCTNAMLIGLTGTTTVGSTNLTTTLPPEDCFIANNIVLQPAGKIIDQRIVPANMTWEANILSGASLGLTATNTGTWRIDPQLVLGADGLWRPGSNSPALGMAQGTNYNFVTNDFEGHLRSGAKDIGCDQASAAAIVYPPLTATNVGPLQMRVRGTFLSWPAPASIPYGTPLDAAQLRATANAPGTFAYSPPAGTILNVGLGQTLTVVFTPNDLANFNVVTQSVTIDVLKATPTITWTNPAAIAYGTPLGSTQLNASVNAPGTLTYNPPSGGTLNAGNGQTLSVTFTPSDTNNYYPATRTVLINVLKATPSITWATPASIEQGVALSAGQLNASANTPGTFLYTPPLGTVLPAGSGQILSVSFTPNDTANYNVANRSVAINVTVGGKTVPTITWPAPAPILFGNPLSALQLNATADVPGTFTYSPAAGAVLPASNGLVLSVTFAPSDTATYAAASKSVTIDVALQTSNSVVRVAYIIPVNRTEQTHAVATLRDLVLQYWKFFGDQMERNGFGHKTFTFEAEPNGTTPLINILHVPVTDTYLRGDIYGGRVIDAVCAAGLPVGAPGQIWWLIPETHVEHPDGSISGGFSVGQRVSTSPADSGWAISGSADLALYQTLYQTNSHLYDGYVVPEIGPYPLVQDISFSWFDGITLSGVSSAAVGAGLRSIGEAFGLDHDYRNDENFNGNLMGFGYSGIRGVLYPDRYPYNSCELSYASALALNVNPFFNPSRLATDLAAPTVSIATSGARAPVNGLLEITFTASDNQGLHAALLTWQTDSGYVLAEEMTLSGTNATGTFRIPYFTSQETNRYTITAFDRQGNRGAAETGIYPLLNVNHSPQPFIRVSPAVVGLGEDVVLDASDTFDPEHGGGLIEVEWDIDGDGVFDTPATTDPVYIVNYFTLGSRLIRARLTDPAGDVAISAPVAVNVQSCLTTLSPIIKSHGYGYSTGTVTVTSGAKCLWTIENTNDWIKILPDTELSSPGKWKLKYYTEPNSEFVGRQGLMRIGSEIYTVLQDPAECTYSLSPTNKFHGYGASTGSFKVSTKTNCTWSVANTNAWIVITSGANGTNTGTVNYSFSDNRVFGRRSGTIFVAGEVFTVTQWGTNCETVLSPIGRTHSENAETNSVTVSVGSSLAGPCSWNAYTTNSWITFTNAANGSNSASLGYRLAPNLTGLPRTGTISINDQVFTITQLACSFGLSSSNHEFNYVSASSNITVTAGPVCSWSINNTNSWIVIDSPSAGVGNGIGVVSYHVLENLRGDVRQGTVLIAGQPLTVLQRGLPCDFTVYPADGDIDSPAEAFLGEEGGYGEIVVSVTDGCAWTAITNAPWIRIFDGQSGAGSGIITYSVDPNIGPARSATISIEDQDFRISQASGVRVIRASDLIAAGGQTNSMVVTLDAHGTENNLSFSLCFDTNLLSFISARLLPTAPLQATQAVDSSQAAQGRVGFNIAMPPTWVMPAGTGVAVQVSFRAAAVNGKPTTTISFCDAPVVRHLGDALGGTLSTDFVNGFGQIIGFCSLAESVDAPELNWTVGAIPWVCQTNVTYDGDDAAVSGPTPDGGESFMEISVLGPGTLSFWWKVSSEPNNDRLRLYMDGTEQLRISGEVDWEWRTFSVPSGTHAMRWRYNKNSSTAVGSDRAWVDEVVYEPAPPTISSQPSDQSVDVGSTATFSVSAAGQPPLSYQWLFNNVALSDTATIRGTHTTTLTLSNVQLAQAGSYSVIVGSAQGNLGSGDALLSVTPLLPLPEALDATQYTWTNSGNLPWGGQPTVTHDGVDAARSGPITHSQSSSFQTTITGPGTVSFWWKVSSEPSNDKLTFYINGSSQSSISGEVDWQQKTFTLGSGAQTLLWTYSKNSSTSLGQDRAWVDEFHFTPAAVTIITPPASQLVNQAGVATFTVGVNGTPPIAYQWLFNGTNLANATNAALAISNVQPVHAGNYSVFVSNIAGSALSTNALLQVNRLVALAEALDATNLVWSTNPSSQTSGTAPWVGQTAVTHDSSDAARSGQTGDSQTSAFQTTVTGPGTITFWWKVSSESGSDKLRFYMGGSQQENISGEQDWTFRSWTVPSGSQTLEWRYNKNSSGAAGQDAGWVDQIYWIPSSTPTPPLMVIHPTNRTVVAPATFSLGGIAIGSATLNYQWFFNGMALANGGAVSGATTTNLTLTAAGVAQIGDYWLVVSNSAGRATSAVASVTVITSPIITSAPTNQNAVAGSTANFYVSALGTAPLGYQWQFNGTNLINGGNVSGVTTTNIRMTSVLAAQAGSYSVVVSNVSGFTTSAIATLTVGTPPLITTQPINTNVLAGQTATFAVSASGTPPLNYQWRWNGTNLVDGNGINGAKTSLLIISNVQTASAGNYSVVVSNALGTTMSSNAVLSVVALPIVTTQPTSQSVAEGVNVSFTVTVTGTAPLTYQWRRNGTNLLNGGSLSGATSSTLTLNNAQPAQAGIYTVVVSNPAGSVNSSNALLTVIAPLSLGEAVNAPYLIWNTDVAKPWTVQTNVTHDGDAAAQSGNITNNDATWIETTVTGPGTIRFYWKVSSQTNADVLNFTVNGSEWERVSGASDWHRESFNLPPGSLTLRWTYSKDAAVTNGADRAWLDEVDFAPSVGPSVPVIVEEPVGQAVDPGTTVTLSVQALGTAPLGYQWRYEGQNLGDGGNIQGTKSPTLTIFNAQVQQSGAYDVVVQNPYSLALSDKAFLSVVPIIPLATALDTDHTNLVWLTGGYSPWIGQSIVNQDRIDAAESGPLPNNQTNWIQTIVAGPGAVNFYWKVSSETNHDRLRFTADGVELANISGEVDWRQRTFFIPDPGTVLRWNYTKDSAGNAGFDRGWVDRVEFVPSAPVITNSGPDVSYVDQGTTVKLSVDVSGTPPFSYQWQFDGTNLVDSDTNSPPYPGFITGAVGNHRLTISNAQPWQSGLYTALVLNQAGTAVSDPMSVQVVPALPLGPALNPNLVWETGGYSWWVGTTNITHDGVMAARNGTLPNSQQTWMRTTVIGPNTLKFWWKASTETNADHLIFSINGVEQVRISGNQNWQQKIFDLNNIGAPYVLQWEYSKNSLFTNNLDQVFVDEVTFTAVAPTVTNQPPAQTLVDAGSTVAFTAAVRGTPPFSYQWRYNGAPVANGGNISGANTDTLRITGVQAAQAGIYALEISNNVGSTLSSNAILSITPVYPLAEALETTNLTWTAGSPAWVGQPVVTHDGVDAARSPALSDSQSSSMQTTLTGPGTVTFWWKVSSETNKDLLTFYINGTSKNSISGEVGWQQMSYTLGSGSQTLKWTYLKNSSVSVGQDRGWVDQLVFTPVPPSITTQPSSKTVDQGSPVAFNVVASGTAPFTYRWFVDGSEISNAGDFSGATTATLSIANAQPFYEGNFYVVIGNAGGNVTSSPALLTVTPLLPLDVALDTTNLVWTTNASSGSPAWVGQTAISHDAEASARVGPMPDSGSSTMQTTLTGPGTIGFWWKVSSETNNDKLTFYTNGTAAGSISGEVDWQFKTFTLGNGSQTLKWMYAKNSSTSVGQDRAWVDQVSFGPVPPGIATPPTNLSVDVGATASFNVLVSGTPPFTYQWQFDGVDIVNGPGVSGATSSNLVLTGVETWQSGNYRVLVASAAGTAVSTNAALTVWPVLTLAEALDAPFTWTTSGSPQSPWVGHGAVSHDGLSAARSGAIGNSTNTSFSTVVTGPGSVSFWWKVSSETNKDLLTFYANGVSQAAISGEVDWQFKTFALGSGSQTLTWTYSKNSSGAVGLDRGFVDQFFFGPVPPTITGQPTNRAVDVGSSASFTVAASGTPPFTYQWQYNGSDLADGPGISGSTSSNLVLTGVQVPQAGNYRVLINGPAGSTNSVNATLTVFPILTLAEALDTPDWIWATNGAPPWVGHGAVSHDAGDAARSGAIGNSGSTAMSTVLNGPGTISFWWKVSSETNNDKLVFTTNGATAATISGEVDWQFKTFALGSGTQTVTWTYSKNSSTAAGLDRGFVDQVSFGLVAPTIISQPANVGATAGSAVTFTVGVAATPPIFYQWLFNGFPLVNGPGVGGATSATLMISNVQNPRLGGYSVIVSNNVGNVTSTVATLSLVVNTNVTLNDSLDGGLSFTTGGTGQPWTGQVSVTHDGADAAQTGAVGDSTYTWIKTTVTGPNTLSFWWKVSSEQDHDYLRFMVDAVDQVKISGEVGWQQITYSVPSGSHELQWRYSKNSSNAAGQDRGWVDQVYYGTNNIPTTEPPSILIQPVSQTVDAGDPVTLSVSAAGSAPLGYYWSCNGTNVVNGGNVSGANTAALTIANVLQAQAGNYSVLVSNSAGAVASVSARITVMPTIDLAEAVDAPELFIMTSGDALWAGEAVVTHDGTDAGHSGRIVDGQSTEMHTMVNGPGTLTFWWKVSSETNADALTMSVNGTAQAAISGEVNWQQRTLALPAGALTLEWTYEKNLFGSAGSDRGWVDQISFVPGNSGTNTNSTPLRAVPPRISVSANKAQLVWEASTERTYKVYYKDRLTDPDWTLLDEEILLTWKVVDGQIDPDVVVATVQDVLAGRTRFYRVFEY